jgi:signal transduction histidine kinase
MSQNAAKNPIPLPTRASREAVRKARSRLLGEELLPAMLSAFPFPAMVLNRERQVLATNDRLLQVLGLVDVELLVGKRPGEALGCSFSGDGPDGCGSDRHCSACGAVRAIMTSQQSDAQVTEECHLLTGGAQPQAVNMAITATPAVIAGEQVTICVFADISAEKRRNVLERVFFHDVLNTAGGIRGIAAILASGNADAERDQEYRRWLLELSDRLVDEIGNQRKLLAAELGEFRPDLGMVKVSSLLREVVSLYAGHEVAHRRQLLLAAVPDCTIVSDGAILRRILGNMVKNALEAVPPGGEVVVAAAEEDETVTFAVQNPGQIPEEVQLQLFQRSFSTKAEQGRGIGTYSIKLFGERYLHGRVGFESSESHGTVFRLTIPKMIYLEQHPVQ